jgi:hypothetical protein
MGLGCTTTATLIAKVATTPLVEVAVRLQLPTATRVTFAVSAVAIAELSVAQVAGAVSVMVLLLLSNYWTWAVLVRPTLRSAILISPLTMRDWKVP